MELTYEMRRAVRHAVGPRAAAVYDVLAHYDSGDGGGVEMTTKLLASESGLSPKTVQRVIAELGDAGLVTSKEQFRDNRQIANRYHLHPVTGGGLVDTPGGQADQANTGIASQLITATNHFPLYSESELLPRELRAENAGEGLRPSTAPSSFEEDSEEPEDDHHSGSVPGDDSGRAELRLPWPPRNSPMPMPVGGQYPRRFIDVANNALWLVTYFEAYVLDHANKARAAKGHKPLDEVPDKRKMGWYDNAFKLVSEHSVHEVVAVIDWVFNARSGYLPLEIAERAMVPHNRKVTRLQQVEESYALLLEAMGSGAEPDPVEEPIGTKRGKVNYGEPLADLDQEARVTELVELFTEFRLAVDHTKEIHHTRTWRWAKTFRIMLANRGYDFGEVKMVITALKDYPEMDRSRYNDAYDLHRNGEWEHVVPAARLERLRAEKRSAIAASAPKRSNYSSNWDDFLARSLATDQDDVPTSIDITSRPLKPLGYYSQNRRDHQ